MPAGLVRAAESVKQPWRWATDGRLAIAVTLRSMLLFGESATSLRACMGFSGLPPAAREGGRREAIGSGVRVSGV